MGRRGLLGGLLLLAACGKAGGRGGPQMPEGLQGNGLYANETPYLRSRINFWARHYEVPSALVQRVVIRESRHRPEARNGPYYGLMQIRPQTARTMGYRGPASGLLHPDVNLRYGVKYLRGAWLVAEGDPEDTVTWYSRGYYYEARRKGLLKRTGLRG
ncbi:transglycosylase SLT domain-containing protein [Paracoccus salsus]|uniref:transglycosylase SLT domain-containing protein n=1 Tax=Paracoccus salsus TaxID=2911061 RepID=UPI003F6DF40F